MGAAAKKPMIHPSTELRHIDAQLGYGVFATERLPRGTITYVWDPLEVEIRPDDPRLAEPVLRDKIERYSYIDAVGTRIVSWDHAKYVNHCCQCNTMSTAYGFEIAIRDIEAGEQITDEYGMFNMPEPMNLSCSRTPCRRQVKAGDLDQLWHAWDEKIMAALDVLELVEQPLWPLVDSVTATQVERYARWSEGYRSVRELGAAAASTQVRSG